MAKKKIDVLDKGFVRLVDSMGDDSAIVQSARVSYGKGTKKVSEDKGLIRYLIRNKHTTPLEMVTFKFHIKAPLFVIRQWHRHRTWSYNEYSGRYSVMSEDCYVPKEQHITTQDPTNKQGGTNLVLDDPEFFSGSFWGDQKVLRDSYEMYIDEGMRRELARINLPLSQYSEMYAKVDLHNLFHFLRLRLDPHAQFEIREYAQAIYDLIKPIVPIASEAFEEYYLNSLTLNENDVNLIKECVSKIYETGDFDVEELAEKIFKNKRERSEAISKVKKVLC